jgi:hypothetical protein
MGGGKEGWTRQNHGAFHFFYLLIYEEEMSGVKPDFATVTDRLIPPIKGENMAFIISLVLIITIRRGDIPPRTGRSL